jgi:hypothetical protein
MSDILSFFRSSYFRSEEAGSVDPDLVKPIPEQPDLSTASKGGHCSFAYGRTRIFSNQFSKSKQSGNEVSFIINDLDNMKG